MAADRPPAPVPEQIKHGFKGRTAGRGQTTVSLPKLKPINDKLHEKDGINRVHGVQEVIIERRRRERERERHGEKYDKNNNITEKKTKKNPGQINNKFHLISSM